MKAEPSERSSVFPANPVGASQASGRFDGKYDSASAIEIDEGKARCRRVIAWPARRLIVKMNS